MMRFLAVVFSACLCVSQAALPLPTYIKPCSRSDPKFNECALQRARDAIPHVLKGDRKYKVPPLDPLEIEEVKVVDEGPRQAGLTLKLKKAKVYGMKNSVIDKTEYDFNKQKIHYEMTLSEAQIIGKYDVSGRILLLPIYGNGDINITLVNCKVVYDHDYTLENIDGKKHIVVKNPTVEVTPSRMHIYTTNLFNGDKRLSDQMNIFLNENWKDVYHELSPAIFTVFSEIITTIINGVAGSVPFDVAFPEKVP